MLIYFHTTYTVLSMFFFFSVLPRFSVSVNMKHAIKPTETSIKIEVSARYG